MERRFCGVCGNPLDMCTCKGVPAERHRMTGFGAEEKKSVSARKSTKYYIERFNGVALAQDEVVVRQYNVGVLPGFFGMFGNGSAELIITNKRVINRQDADYFGMSSCCIEELELATISGVANAYARGFTVWRVIVGLIALGIGFSTLETVGSNSFMATPFWLPLLAFAIGIYMALTCRRPGYLFTVYAGQVGQALKTSVNLRGKIQNSFGEGIIFQYKPTDEAVEMMREIGACIMDLKTKGDYAIDSWKKD